MSYQCVVKDVHKLFVFKLAEFLSIVLKSFQRKACNQEKVDVLYQLEICGKFAWVHVDAQNPDFQKEKKTYSRLQNLEEKIPVHLTC